MNTDTDSIIASGGRPGVDSTYDWQAAPMPNQQEQERPPSVGYGVHAGDDMRARSPGVLLLHLLLTSSVKGTSVLLWCKVLCETMVLGLQCHPHPRRCKGGTLRLPIQRCTAGLYTFLWAFESLSFVRPCSRTGMLRGGVG